MNTIGVWVRKESPSADRSSGNDTKVQDVKSDRVLPKDTSRMLVEDTTLLGTGDTARYYHDGKSFVVSRTDYDVPAARFGITITVNGVERELCPQRAARQHVPYGPAEGTPFYVSHAQTPVRPRDRVTVRDVDRFVSTTVIIG